MRHLPRPVSAWRLLQHRQLCVCRGKAKKRWVAVLAFLSYHGKELEAKEPNECENYIPSPAPSTWGFLRPMGLVCPEPFGP